MCGSPAFVLPYHVIRQPVRYSTVISAGSLHSLSPREFFPFTRKEA